jgi:peptide/nickel transport system substrate-binding protein
MTRFKYAGLLLLLLATVAFSCRSDSDNRSAYAEKIDFKRSGNEVVVRLPAEPDGLNPILTTLSYARYVNEQIFQPLLDFDPETYELIPILAAARPTVEPITTGPAAGGLAYTFTIRDEATWPNGDPVTAADVIFSYKVLLNPKVNAAPYRPYLESLAEVTVDPEDFRRFTVLTDEEYILGEASVGNIAVYPRYFYDPEGLLDDIALADLADPDKSAQLAEDNANLAAFAETFNSAPYQRDPDKLIGSGPYRLVEWQSGERIVLERREDYWGQDLDGPRLAAGPERIVFEVIPDQTTAANAVRDEIVDAAIELDNQDFVRLRDNAAVQAKFRFETEPAYKYYYILLNTKDPRLSDRRVRRALAHLIDVDGVIDNIYSGLATRTVGPVHPTKSYYDDSLAPIAYDPDRARALLADAGWTDSDGDGVLDKEIDGETVPLRLNYLTIASSTFGNNLAQIYQENARQAGVEINIQPKEVQPAIGDLRTRDYQLYGGAFGNLPVPDDFKQLWHTESDTPTGYNRSGFGNAETDALIDEIRTTLDEDKRDELYKRFQRILYEEQPMIFLFAPDERIVVSKRFDATTTSLAPGFQVADLAVQEQLAN